MTDIHPADQAHTDILDFSSLNPEDQHLANESIQARNNAYCPYSKLKVGTALLCDDGTIFTGCNVENASYPLSICAEKTVITKAISEGHRHFKKIAISSLLDNKFVTPCGGCRQVIAEFSNKNCDIEVLVIKADRTHVIKTKISTLLPLSFTF